MFKNQTSYDYNSVEILYSTSKTVLPESSKLPRAVNKSNPLGGGGTRTFNSSNVKYSNPSAPPYVGRRLLVAQDF